MFNFKKLTKKKRKNYSVIKQTLKNNDIGIYKTYGIKQKNGKVIVSDVACDFKTVKKIVYKINKYQAEPIHIFDIVLDTIA